MAKNEVATRRASVLLAIFLVFSTITGAIAIPRSTLAFADGNGTEETPYRIETCEDLDDIANDLSAYYVLTRNIDCFDVARIPIGDHAQPFTGNFDGDGYTIRTYVGTGVNSYAGLFGSISAAEVYDLNLEGLVIANGNYVGGLAGEATGNSRVTHVTSSMEIQATGDNVGGLIGGLVTNVTGSFTYNSASGEVSGNNNVGGLYGYATLSNISKSFATGSVTAAGENAGGLIGYSGGYGASEVYASGAVVAGQQRAGGLIGLQENGAITDSYARGIVTAQSPGFYAGGLIGAVGGGFTTIQRSYSTGTATGYLAVGGLVGYSVGETYIYDSFTTSLVSGVDATVNSFVGQDFDNILITANAYANADNNKYCMVGSSNQDRGGCTQVSITGNPTKFFAASDEPLNISDEQVWDVTNVWATSDNDYPTLRSSADVHVGPHDDQDLNGDSIPDSDQPNIGGYTSSYTGKTVAIDVGQDCELTTDDMTEESSLAVQDPAYDYANGLWEWEADCSVETTTVKLYYYDVSAAGLTARKFSTITNTYFTLDDATIEETNIHGSPVTVVTYQVTDNSERDMNPDVGMINDPAGIATAVSSNSSGSLANSGSKQTYMSSLGIVMVVLSTGVVFSRKRFVANRAYTKTTN